MGPGFAGFARKRNRSREVRLFRNWVRKFIGFVKPRKWDQARRDDVERFLDLLVREGEARCQFAQASEALEIFFREVALMVWARHAPSSREHLLHNIAVNSPVRASGYAWNLPKS